MQQTIEDKISKAVLNKHDRLVKVMINHIRNSHLKLKIDNCQCVVCNVKRKAVQKKLALHRVNKYIDTYYDCLSDEHLINLSSEVVQLKREIEELKASSLSWSKLIGI